MDPADPNNSHNPTHDHNFFSNSSIDNRYGGTIQVNASLPASMPILEILRPYICTRAMFNGDDRDDAPKCHEETRKSIFSDIEPWAVSVDSKTGILWLTGPVGTGKSAISRKVCEDLNRKDPRLLAGSFFFWRSDDGRNSLKAFIPTIVHRLCEALPEVGELMQRTLTNDLSILDRTLEVQWDTLIIKPLCQALLNTEFTQRSLVVIDGLDECEPYSYQQRLLQLLPTLQQNGLHRRIAVLIASRPESHIQSQIEILSHDHPSLFRLPHLTLSETEESKEDMRLILTTSFNDIYRFRRKIIGNRLWPPEGAIDRIIDAAKGQFIYVLTIVRWLSEKDGHPIDRLEAIFRTYDDQQARAFAPLDRLYALILEVACNTETGNLVLPCLFLLSNGSFSFLSYVSTLSRLFREDDGHIRLIFQPLHSVLHVPDDDASDLRVAIYHKSFTDCLQDRSRSGDYWLGDPKVVALLLTKTLELEYGGLGFTSEDKNLGLAWLSIPRENIELTSELLNCLAQTGAVDWVNGFQRTVKENEYALQAFSHTYLDFCNWVRSKSRSIPTSNKSQILYKFRPLYFESRRAEWMWTFQTWWLLLWG
ncbi:hypothetical protein AX16_005968 [Volvariella volvacea WC 439]|nr:hypothetical protein AX16_005968 [Volvariella volvacea WC 439]